MTICKIHQLISIGGTGLTILLLYYTNYTQSLLNIEIDASTKKGTSSIHIPHCTFCWTKSIDRKVIVKSFQMHHTIELNIYALLTLMADLITSCTLEILAITIKSLLFFQFGISKVENNVQKKHENVGEKRRRRSKRI